MLDDVIRSSWGYKKIKGEGLEEGRQELRQALLEITQGRFPALEPLAKKTAKAINKPAILRHMIVQLSMAQSEEIAEQVLLTQGKSKN